MRVENWQKNFWGVINAKREAHFEWGKFDCATFAIDCICSVRGPEFRQLTEKAFGTWNTALGAAKASSPHLSVCATAILGKPKLIASLGMADLGLFNDLRDRPTFCIHDGANFICPEAVGLQRVPFNYVHTGWKI